MYQKIENVIGNFIKMLAIQPEKTIVSANKKEITYAEMDRMSDILAHEIQKRTKKKRERILLLLGHNYKVIVSILAVLKTGNSYIPVATTTSEERINYIAACSNAKFMITDRKNDTGDDNIILTNNFLEVSPLEKVNQVEYECNDEVCVLFTSGSTGDPMGVSVSYENILYILNNMEKICPTGTDAVYSFTTPYTFDVSTTEIYGWIGGGKIEITDLTDYEVFRAFPQIVKQQKITHLAISPSGLVNMFSVYSHQEKNEMAECLKYVMVAGDKFKKSIADEWNANNWKFRLFNLYGPTEGTVYALGYELKHGEKYTESIPIGTPLEGCGYFIDAQNENGTGELVLYGNGIAKTYINNDTEAKKRFGLYEGKRSYRTGDIVCLQDEIVYYLGRNDDQVQINGIRVELGEIEHMIADQDNISDVCVAYHNGIIIANVCTKDASTLDVGEFNKHLLEVMPKYMVPNYINVVPALVLNENKKADRKAVISDYLNRKDSSRSEENMNKDISEKTAEFMSVNPELFTPVGK